MATPWLEGVLLLARDHHGDAAILQPCYTASRLSSLWDAGAGVGVLMCTTG